MYDLYFICLQVSIVSYVYAEILISEGHILHGFHKWLTARFTTPVITELPAPPEVAAMPGYVPVKHIRNKKSPFLKPLGDCPLCMAGQLTLWVLLYRWFAAPHLPAAVTHALSIVTLLIVAICVSVALTLLLKKLVEKWSR